MSTDTTKDTNDVAPVAWFEIGTEDPEAARSFYGELFGWTFNVNGPYSEIGYGPGRPPQGGIQDTSAPLPDGTPRTYAVPYVQVVDVTATCAEIEERGGKVMVPATTVPTGLVYAHVTDPFGNHFGLFSPPA
jgi:predicted enzyme related to lactoylglutathione lyase